MNVEQYLENFYKTTKNPTLKAMQYFMKEFDNPDKKLKIIHVAGTNGKGSVTEMLTNILIKQGYKVGKYISPHLIRYNERISINNKDITNEQMEEIINKLQDKIHEYNLNNMENVTLFELLTTMSLLYFYENKCDFVILETGLGGMYDCTNIVNPIVSVITSVGYDHMNILGNTIEEIAKQKAGIIKQDSSTVFMEQEENVNKIIEETCKKKNNTLVTVKKKDIVNKRYENDALIFDYKDNKNIELNLKSAKQFENASLCLEVINILRRKENVEDKAVREGLSTVIHKGRFEMLQKNPTIIYDGAHNEPAILDFIDTVNKHYEMENKNYIFSILKTKDYKSVLKHLLKDEQASFVFTSGNNKEMYVPKEELYNYAYNLNPHLKIEKCELLEAIDNAKLKKDVITFIIGSFYIYKDVSEKINHNRNNKTYNLI